MFDDAWLRQVVECITGRAEPVHLLSGVNEGSLEQRSDGRKAASDARQILDFNCNE